MSVFGALDEFVEEGVLPVEQGFNTDVVFAGQRLHVQTEDWGQELRQIVTRVFKSGVVLKTVRRNYDETIRRGHQDHKTAVRLALAEQHQEILDQLARGELDHR